MAFAPVLVAALSGMSKLLEVGQARAQADATAKAHQYNARVLENQASATAQQAGQAEDLQRRRSREAFGKMRAAGAQGGLLESESFGDVYGQAAAEAELDALNIRYEGEVRRTGLLNEAAGERYQSRAAQASKPSWLMGGIGAATSALTSYSQMGGTFGKPATAGAGTKSTGWKGPRY